MEESNIRFQLNTTLTEELHLAFREFDCFEMPHGKKQVRKVLISFVTLELVIVIALILAQGWNRFTATYTILTGIWLAFSAAFYKKMTLRRFRKQYQQLKMQGDVSFLIESRVEIYDDRLVDITPTTRIEDYYEGLKQICVVEGKFILLYFNRGAAHIFPVAQLAEQVDQEEFLNFLSEKCTNVTYH